MPPLSTMGPLLFLLLGGANAALFMRGGGANRNKRGRQQDHAINVVEQALDAAGAAPRKPSADDAASTHFYDSAVKDHFTTSIATAKEPKWSQRYYVDSTFWKGEGYPVFLYIGGEGPQSAPSSRLFMWTLAEQHAHSCSRWSTATTASRGRAGHDGREPCVSDAGAGPIGYRPLRDLRQQF